MPIVCYDGDPCTLDFCMTSSCQSQDAGPECLPDVPCTADADCPTIEESECVGTACDLALGVCQIVPTHCDDGDPCTDDECGADQSTCDHTPNNAAGCK